MDTVSFPAADARANPIARIEPDAGRQKAGPRSEWHVICIFTFKPEVKLGRFG